jgi:L-asparagine oxygenase
MFDTSTLASSTHGHRFERFSELTLSLSNAELERLRDIAQECVDASVVTDPEAFVMLAQDHASSLPAGVLERLRIFRRFGSPTGGLLIHGCPVFEVPATPRDPTLSVGTRLTAAGVLGIMTAVIGDQYGFRPELSGHIIQDIVPVPSFELSQQSISSEEALCLHVESAFTEDRADYVALFCLRADHDRVAATTLSSIENIMPQLSARTIEILRQPRFKTAVDESFLRGIGSTDPIYVGPIRVFSGSLERPRIRADFSETTGLDDEAQSALEILGRCVQDTATAIRLEPGDLLYVDNHHAFHGRTSFRARWDGADRWLLRTFVTRDLARTEGHRPMDGRIVDIDYCSGDDIYISGTTYSD